jgi:hypothetical protein
MLARLIGYSSDMLTDGAPTWRFDIEIREVKKPHRGDDLARGYVAMIASVHKDGPLSRLCRAIRDTKEGDYAALVGAISIHISRHRRRALSQRFLILRRDSYTCCIAPSESRDDWVPR